MFFGGGLLFSPGVPGNAEFRLAAQSERGGGTQRTVLGPAACSPAPAHETPAGCFLAAACQSLGARPVRLAVCAQCCHTRRLAGVASTDTSAVKRAWRRQTVLFPLCHCRLVHESQCEPAGTESLGRYIVLSQGSSRTPKGGSGRRFFWLGEQQ